MLMSYREEVPNIDTEHNIKTQQSQNVEARRR
jgi:hypothetical protein